MPATEKRFADLLKALNEFDDVPRQRLLVKARVPVKPKPKPLPRQELGLLLKSAIDHAVVSGRLSGTTAVAGLRALGLEEK